VQKRIIDYGGFLTEQLIGLAARSVLPVGPYAGLELVVVGTDRYKVTPGSALMPNGVTIVETEDISFDPIVPIPTAPTTFTLKLKHEAVQLLGGQAALYSLVTGISPAGANEIVLGYLVHPGGGAALASYMWRPTPRLRYDLLLATNDVRKSLVLYAPHRAFFALGTYSTHTTELNTDIVYDVIEVNGLAPSPAGDNSTVTLPFVATGNQPYSISIEHKMPTNSTVQVYLLDTVGTSTLLGNFIGTAGISTSTFAVAPTLGGTFTKDSLASIRLVCNIKTSTSASFGKVVVNHNPLP
jgi:hypothetical protein